MKVTNWIPKEEPKTKAAALRLAAQVSNMQESIESRRSRLMKLETEHQQKIAKLTAKLEQIKKEISECSPETATQYIESLKLKHSLTDAEILELKSEILRKSIENKQVLYSELKPGTTKLSDS